MSSDKVVRRFTAKAQDTRIFGEPYETADGSTIITVARPGGGPRAAAPLGIFVVHNGEVKWESAVDTTRIALLGEVIGLAATVFTTLAILRRPPWPDVSAAGLRAMRELHAGWQQRRIQPPSAPS